MSMTGAAEGGEQPRKHTVRNVIIAAAVIILVLLLLRTCRKAAPPAGFDYFVTKAGELGNDSGRIIAFVRDDLPLLSYRGDARGALGALWNGSASADEKLLLANALLSAAHSKKTVTLEDVAPSRDKANETPALNLRIVHRTELAGGEPKDTPIYDGPAGPLVGDVHTVEVVDEHTRKVTLRPPGGNASAPVNVMVPDEAVGEDLVFTWRKPGDAAGVPPQTTLRELWHRGNRTGASGVNAGDRHDFVVIPCRIGKYVREKEELLLKQRGREQSPEARAYLGLLDYALESDWHLKRIEKTYKVTARMFEPRVLIMSRFVAPDLPGKVAYAIDLRIDRANFAANPSSDASPSPTPKASTDKASAKAALARPYQAAQVRSFLESSLEHQFLQRFSGLPSSAAFEVFTLLKDDEPNTAGRRVELARSALESLQAQGSPANAAKFAVAPEKPDGTPPAKVTVTFGEGGFQVAGGPILKQVADRLAQEPDAVKLPASGTATFADIDQAAAAVETALLAADVKPSTDPSYPMLTTIGRSSQSLLCPNARLHLRWGEGDAATDERIRIRRTYPALDYQWRVQTGVLPAAGTRVVEPEALRFSTIHNPWYLAGSTDLKRETSLVVSQAVYRSIKAGKPIDLSVEREYQPKDDPKATRPVKFTAPLTPVGAATIMATVNGRPEQLPIIRCTLRGQPVAILDDPLYPVGMADGIQSVITGINCRLVDERGVPLSGVEVLGHDRGDKDRKVAAQVTAPDGYFRLPPPPQLDEYKDLYLDLTFRDGTKRSVRTDVKTPGLSTVEIKTERPRLQLKYVTKSNARDFDRLTLSDEVKRQAKRDVDAGRMVVIPDHYVLDGGRPYTAYYACDSATGEYSGVTEDGLCGSTNWLQNVQVSREEVLKALKEMASDPAKAGTSGVIHAMRGAIFSWWVYSTCRIGGDSHRQAIIDTLNAMNAWADLLDIPGTFGKATNDKLGDKLGDLLNSGAININGDAEKLAFKLGYIGGTLYLAEKLEGTDAED